MNTLGAIGHLLGLTIIAALVMFGVPFAIWLFLGAGQ